MASTFDTIETQLAAGRVESILPDWTLGPEAVEALADETIKRGTAVYDAIAAAKTAPTWAKTLGAMTAFDNAHRIAYSMCYFPGKVSASKDLRDACAAAEKKLNEWGVTIASRHDVYEAIKAFSDAEGDKLEGEDARYLKRVLRDYERKGMHLDEATRSKILELGKRQSELSVQFAKNLGEENTRLNFSREELAGLPEDFLKELEKEDDKFVLTLKYPHYIPVQKLCKVDATRKAMEFAFNSRCKEQNVAILEELAKLRHEMAQLLGFKTHADFITAIRMSGSQATVAKFLSELAEKLTPGAEKEMATLVEIKEREQKAAGQEVDPVIRGWDMSFYRNIVTKEKYQVDHEEIKQYFPIQVVTKGLLDIYQELLGLKFTEIKTKVWHEDVQTFEVRNSSDDSIVGFFYLDLHPREGKYGHAACFGLQPSVSLAAGGRMVPVCALVCNFTKPTADAPSLLLHDEVETFFHEFGHGCHQLCALSKHATFAGTAVERDFVEAPSQMLENWVWEPEALKRLSGRLSDGATLPDELIEKLVGARNANAALLNKRQVFLATMDQAIHTTPNADTAEIYARLSPQIYGVQMTPGTNMTASFGHLAGGYDAQYYGYLWSEVYAADMYETKFKGRIFSPEAGMEYRQKILQPGGSKDAIDMLRDFLGREPSTDAFLRMKEIAA